MSTINKQRRVATLLGTVLSLLAVVLVVLSFFSLIAKKTQPTEEEELLRSEQTSTEKYADNADQEAIQLPPLTTAQQPQTEESSLGDATTVQTEAPTPTEPAKTTSVSDIAFYLPVGGATVSKAFSDEVATFSLTMNDYRVHTGTDLYAPVGTNVVACADGVIEKIWQDPFKGYCVSIDHGAGVQSVYCNLSENIPANLCEGGPVAGGDVIGGVGESMITELADAPHVHFEMCINGQAVDPMQYCPQGQSTSAQDE